MATNYIQTGENLTLTAPAAVVSGDGVLVGSIFGVAQTAAAANADVAVAVMGVYELPKLSTDAVTQGALIYWDNTNKRCTVTATGNTKIGAATAASAAGVTTVRVRLSAAF